MNINSTLFSIVNHTCNDKGCNIEFTDKGLELAAKVALKGRFKPLSGQAVKMLMECSEIGRFESSSKGYSSSVVAELLEPWKLANSGAVLYPQEFQPWESDDEVFFMVDNPQKLGGNFISATFYAEFASHLISAELTALKKRISNEVKLPKQA
jgi:hypothetical protein